MKTHKYKPTARRGLLIFVLLLVCISYLAVRRHWAEVLLYSFLASVPLGIRMARFEGRHYFEASQTFGQRLLLSTKLLLPGVFCAVLLIPVGMGVYGAAAAFFDGFQWVALALSDRSRSTTFAVIVTGAAGLALFGIRIKWRVVYGLTEAVVGLLVAGHRANSDGVTSADVALVLAILTAGVYLVVRGLDNVHQGWKSETDPIAKWFAKRQEPN